MLAGNVAALLSPLIFIPILTYSFGKQNYDWESMKQIRRGDDSDLAAMANVDLELTPGATSRSEDMEAAEQAKLKKAALIARSLTVFMTLALLILWPMPMYGSGYIFSKKFFTGRAPLTFFQVLADKSERLGQRGYLVALLQHGLRGDLPPLARPEDHGPHSQVHVPGHHRQEEADPARPYPTDGRE